MFQESMVVIECVIPKAHHRTVMGAKGYKVQGITQDHDVQIKFPDREIERKHFLFLFLNKAVDLSIAELIWQQKKMAWNLR